MNPFAGVLSVLSGLLADPAAGVVPVYQHAGISATVRRARYAEAAFAIAVGYLALRMVSR